MVQLSHPCMTTGKTTASTLLTFVGKVMSLPLNMLSRFVIAFLPRSKQASFSFVTIVTIYSDLEPKKIKSVTVSTFPPPIFHEEMGPDAMILVFLIMSFKPAFSLSSFTLIKRLLSSSSLSAIRVLSSPYLRSLMFLPAIYLHSSLLFIQPSISHDVI